MILQCCACGSLRETFHQLWSTSMFDGKDRLYPYCEPCWTSRKPKALTLDDYVREIEDGEQADWEISADRHVNSKTRNF